MKEYKNAKKDWKNIVQSMVELSHRLRAKLLVMGGVSNRQIDWELMDQRVGEETWSKSCRSCIEKPPNKLCYRGNVERNVRQINKSGSSHYMKQNGHLKH